MFFYSVTLFKLVNQNGIIKLLLYYFLGGLLLWPTFHNRPNMHVPFTDLHQKKSMYHSTILGVE